jgi:hypothetical protein
MNPFNGISMMSRELPISLDRIPICLVMKFGDAGGPLDVPGRCSPPSFNTMKSIERANTDVGNATVSDGGTRIPIGEIE